MRNVNSNFYPCDDRKKGRGGFFSQKRTSLLFFSFLSQRRHFRRERERERDDCVVLPPPRCLCVEPKRKSVRVEIFVVSFAMRANIMRDITFTLSLKIYESSSSSSREISDEKKDSREEGFVFHRSSLQERAALVFK